MPDIMNRTFPAHLNCLYLLRTPPSVDARSLLVVTLHGFGAEPETMLPLTRRLFDAQAVIASLEGPYQFFRDAKAREVGHGWITSKRPNESIRLHHQMVSHVLDEVGGEFNIPPARRILVGFSQSVSLNYRFVATCPEAVRGVVAICGGLPSDWETGAYQPVRAAVLHIARRQDEFYPPEVTEHYAERLRRRAADVEFHLIDGGHQMPSGGNLIVGPWAAKFF
jgi:predicted esterase